MLLEYVRMGLITRQDALEIARALQAAERGTVAPDPGRNMSDISFALERHVEGLLSRPVPCWHIDRSRNDVQACAKSCSAVRNGWRRRTNWGSLFNRYIGWPSATDRSPCRDIPTTNLRKSLLPGSIFPPLTVNWCKR